MSEGVQRVVHVEDGVQGCIEVLPILAPERMSELLAAELEKRGYARTGVSGEEVLVKVGDDKVTVEINVRTGTVTVSIAEDITVDVKVGGTGLAESVEAAAALARMAANRQVATAIAPLREQARQAATAKLESELIELRPELDAAVTATTAEALLEKARQLGDIESIEGSAEAGTLTIKVRV
ncbi:MAG: hypothetical protein EXR69_05995 [Myxococcales bacterium]|nr:hypothetical protein [Myxococcales bacterium]